VTFGGQVQRRVCWMQVGVASSSVGKASDHHLAEQRLQVRRWPASSPPRRTPSAPATVSRTGGDRPGPAARERV